MLPDDPRHGTNGGYVAGCREDCCRKPHMVYMKRWRMKHLAPLVPLVGIRRRIDALEAIGWTRGDISRALGKDRNYIKQVLYCDAIQSETARAIYEVYDRLSMTVPRDPEERSKGQWNKHEAARKRAARLGYAPPLAWDDNSIDDPSAEPYRAPKHTAAGRPVLRDQHIENAEWMADAGENLTAVCNRLNLKPETFYQACRRNGRTDLYAVLSSREPTGEMATTLRKTKQAAA